VLTGPVRTAPFRKTRALVLCAIAVTIAALLAVVAPAEPAAADTSGPVVLQQVGSGLCATIPDGLSGNNPVLGPCDSVVAATFSLNQSPSNRSARRIRLTAVDSCLSVPDDESIPASVESSHDCANNDSGYDLVKDWVPQANNTLQHSFKPYKLPPIVGCLDSESAKTAPGTALAWGSCTGSTTQQWSQVPANAPAKVFVRQLRSGLCAQIDRSYLVTAACKTDGTWYPVRASGGSRLRLMTSGKDCVEADTSRDVFARVRGCVSSTAGQNLQVLPASGGGFVIAIAPQFDRCLDDITTDGKGAKILFNTCNNSVSQVWTYATGTQVETTLTSVGRSRQCLVPTSAANGATVAVQTAPSLCAVAGVSAWRLAPASFTDWYRVHWAPLGQDSGKCLDLSYGATSLGTHLVIGACNATQPTQLWLVNGALADRFQLINPQASTDQQQLVCADATSISMAIQACANGYSYQQLSTA
jgi:hypothetical protein